MCKIFVTDALRNLFEHDEEGLANFIRAFAHWKSNWPSREYASVHFGKDAYYRAPPVAGQFNRLRHVHLRPMVDSLAASLWDYWFRRGKRKTSNRVLVYAHDTRTDCYLLIYILVEPTAHRIAAMRTERDRRFMEKLAAVAEAFLDDGRIIA